MQELQAEMEISRELEKEIAAETAGLNLVKHFLELAETSLHCTLQIDLGHLSDLGGGRELHLSLCSPWTWGGWT